MENSTVQSGLIRKIRHVVSQSNRDQEMFKAARLFKITSQLWQPNYFVILAAAGIS